MQSEPMDRSMTLRSQQQPQQAPPATTLQDSPATPIIKRQPQQQQPTTRSSSHSHDAPQQQPPCQVNHRHHLLQRQQKRPQQRQQYRSANRDFVTQTVADALELALDLLEEEADYARDLAMSGGFRQGQLASDFAEQQQRVAVKRKR